MTVRVVLEVAAKRSFASALDWPGWARGARSPDDAVNALVAYAPRFAVVAERVGIPFTPPASTDELDVVERLRGGSGTEFGVPGTTAGAEDAALDAEELERFLALLASAWATFDEAATRARSATLRVGPRGGGRQVPKMVDHVMDSQAAYLHQLGAKVPRPTPPPDEIRSRFVDAIRLLAGGEAPPEPNRVARPWPPRYAIRRSAWHALDHAWEIEDRRPAPVEVSRVG